MRMESDFIKRVIDNIASFAGKGERQVERETYAGIIRSFSIADLEDSEISRFSLDEIMDKAQNLLDDFSVELQPPVYYSHLAVKELGRKKQNQNQKGEVSENQISKAALHMAHVLSAYEEDITLTVSSYEDSRNKLQTDFIISSCEENEETIESMIRGVFGQVKTEAVSSISAFHHQVHAKGKVIYPGKGKKPEAVDFTKIESWISTLLTALPSGGNFTASIRFCPLSSSVQRDIEKRIQELSGCYNKLKFYSELNWNNSSSFGSNINPQDHIIAKAGEYLFGNNQMGDSYTVTMALSGNDVDKQAQNRMELLEYEIRRLQQALDTVSWGLELYVTALDINTLQVVTSLLTGTLEYHHVKLSWDSDSGHKSSLVLNQEEILPFLYFPTKEFCGFSFRENETFALVSESADDAGFPIGNILWNSRPFAPFSLSADALSRHAFICGMTGGGKTNTVFNLIAGVDIPFCVIEPVKGEYRALRSIFPDLRILTMKTDVNTDELIEIAQLNPFWFPQNASLSYHIDSIRTIIASAFELSEAMPNILEQCLYNVYIDSGWDIVMNRNVYSDILPEEYLYPTFSDLCGEIEEYLEASDYSEEVKGNYKGALLSRMKSFINGYKGILLNTTAHPDYETLMNSHCVIELEGLADDADKCLVMGTILVQYYQYLKLHFQRENEKQKVQHLLIIEEAHRLFKNNQNRKKSEGPDPTGQLVDSLSNMMAEIRAFGEGMLIVDQSPTKIAEDVIKNSATKIVHRIDNGNDIKVMQSSMLLPDDLLSFASLQQGEALIRTDRMTKPCKIKLLLSNVKEDYSLAATYRTNTSAKNKMSDTFLANSILADENISVEMQELIQIYLNNLVMQGCTHWTRLTEDLMCQVIQLLQKYKKFDSVENLNVLSEMSLLSVRRMFLKGNKREMGMIHMFLKRLLIFYNGFRNGKRIKPVEIELFEQYLRKNLQEILFLDNIGEVPEVRFSELCEVLEVSEESFFASVVCRFVREVWPALLIKGEEKEISQDLLLTSFLKNYCLQSVRDDVFEKHSKTFAALAEYLNQLIIVEKVDEFSCL